MRLEIHLRIPKKIMEVQDFYWYTIVANTFKIMLKYFATKKPN